MPFGDALWRQRYIKAFNGFFFLLKTSKISMKTN